VAEADEPGAKVAEVARRHEVSRNILWTWRKQARAGRLTTSDLPYPSGEPHLPFQVKPLSSVLMDDLKVAHKYGGDDGA
jgi:transposase